MILKETLIRYRVLIQYLEEALSTGDTVYPDRASYEKVFQTYDKAKKDALRTLRSIKKADKEILLAKIEPVLLEETLSIESKTDKKEES